MVLLMFKFSLKAVPDETANLVSTTPHLESHRQCLVKLLQGCCQRLDYGFNRCIQKSLSYYQVQGIITDYS
ncbi:hypothetical protein Y1Q_0002625 [Alligator mississippiensis]|uniref:Uncharacterized protein n=1 Tax=Alligator mississippiensis TaxID=8496 RepID=A0A151NZW9_ALLMI|nr:hypothetical protein Y1Q_0002625 [Alligator mississippiensis]